MWIKVVDISIACAKIDAWATRRQMRRDYSSHSYVVRNRVKKRCLCCGEMESDSVAKCLESKCFAVEDGSWDRL